MTWATALLLLTLPSVANAERLRSFWHLEPVSANPETATFESPFLDLKFRPLHVVRMIAPSSATNMTEGSMLFLVFDERGRAAYCSRPEDSAANRAKSMLTGLLNKTPCFIDYDRDGSFDAAFQVFYAPEAVPSPHGSMNSAISLPEKIKYTPENTYNFPENRVRSLRFHGKKAIGQAIIQVGAHRNNYGIFPSIRPDGKNPAIYDVYNQRIELQSISGDVASIRVESDPLLFAFVDRENYITFGPLPSHVLSYMSQVQAK